MSFWKFWEPKPKNRKEQVANNSDVSAAQDSHDQKDSPSFERKRSRNQMSVSRSGRYKQRQRRRSGILDNPTLSVKTPDSPEATDDVQIGGDHTVEKCFTTPADQCEQDSVQNCWTEQEKVRVFSPPVDLYNEKFL
ncbi:uncharacterized protein LOC106473302 [Limulus polyphemus]|uniref:Uncharacterized protein LOC106473302 n=1 Tax=Limulus polyphemus TaxID=6850 RepID=A0ABM1BVF5_LIMPO|nr:uncharacterized protein LOC106473302 [Limulus polyphemus]XP_022257474.1 uncharacterized protein LOC106473302 [Limulus polyphemus]